MPGTKKKADPSKIIKPAMELFASKGFSNVTLTDIAKASGVPVAEVRALYPTKEELLIAAFRIGQRKMEERFRTIHTGDLESHIEEMFDGIKDGLMPFGPELHLNIIYQATEDRTLMEIVKRSSKNVNFAVKAYLMQMVNDSIIDEVEGVEKVNEDMVTSFIEYTAQLLQGKKLPAVKKAWVAGVRAKLKPSTKTAVPMPF
ncbi:MAG: TetR/AcrR family transcriptional regulator [Methanomassiliicoccus sp.]|nr:TetR/AcrR family transcriptional regulator [Methanomassiliicoccus sp.]